MGGVDKGLHAWQGRPLIEHVLQRLAPQVGHLAINANRNLADYAALGHPVHRDAQAPDGGIPYAGPMAGLLAGLEACRTDWLVCVPCDAPLLPHDLVERLVAALAEPPAARLAVAVSRESDGSLQPQPVFCLLHTSLRTSLGAWITSGQSKVMMWLRQEGCAQAVFEQGDEFFNANTLGDLARSKVVQRAK
ncbi:MAG: molybdenum cofactor guanylyltransferase [Burkholderiales bacterium]|nr:molybdenum cofactor guanylyltransferase [Burkholderiales bacterium]